MPDKANPGPERPDILVSVDGEFTGPIPPLFSMISFGAVAYAADGKELSRFKANLLELAGSARDPVSMAWWAEHPEAWAAATKNPIGPEEGMRNFDAWLRSLGGRPRLMGWPLPVDFLFIYWYYVRFLGERPPFGKDGLDIKSYAAGKLGLEFGAASRTVKEDLDWLGIRVRGLEHDPADDADRQGRLYFALSARRP